MTKQSGLPQGQDAGSRKRALIRAYEWPSTWTARGDIEYVCSTIDVVFAGELSMCVFSARCRFSHLVYLEIHSLEDPPEFREFADRAQGWFAKAHDDESRRRSEFVKNLRSAKLKSSARRAALERSFCKLLPSTVSKAPVR